MSAGKYRIWTTGSADAILDRASRADREAYANVCQRVLEVNPYPQAGSDSIWRSLRFREWFYSYYDGSLPFIIRYVVDELPTIREGVVTVFALDDEPLPGDPVTLP